MTNAHPITIEQYENSFEGHPWLMDELIRGKIVVYPVPKPLHQQVLMNILLLLNSACRNTSHAVSTRTGIRFPDQNSKLAPDVFVISKAEMERAVETNDYLNAPPVLVVEVASSETEDLQRIGDKAQVYLDAGVDRVWVVEPEKRILTIHSLNGETICEGDMQLWPPSPIKGMVKIADFFAGIPE